MLVPDTRAGLAATSLLLLVIQRHAGLSPFGQMKNRGTKTSSYLCVVTQPVRIRTELIQPPPTRQSPEHWSRACGRPPKGEEEARADRCAERTAARGESPWRGPQSCYKLPVVESKDRMS